MKSQSRILFATLLVSIVFIFFFMDLDHYLHFEFIKDQHQSFLELYKQSPFQMLFIYSFVYIITAALSLPGAAPLTLLAGALFGLVIGTIVVSFASTIGATLAFLISRFLFKDWVQNRFSKHLEKINRGIDEKGVFYLFTLRLIPVFPFFVINLVMGLTPIRTKTFFLVSQAGMLAATIIYVNAGSQLAQIDSLKGFLSPHLIFSFCLLGFFPLIAKKLLYWIKKLPKVFDS